MLSLCNTNKFDAIDDGVKESAAWLKNCRSPWPSVLKHWKNTAPLRFKELFGHTEEEFINSYLEKWNVLSHKSGCDLILEDFALLYPDSASNLFLNWDSFQSKTFSIAQLDIKDKECKSLLKSLPDLNENGKASLLLQILPAIRASHSIYIKGSRIKISISDARNSYLIYCKVAADINRCIAERRALLKGDNCGGQPLMVLVGPSWSDVQSVYVSVAKLLYRLEGVVSAIDCFFKAFHSFHIEYPPESAHICIMLQRAVYKVKTQWDSKCPIPASWISQY